MLQWLIPSLCRMCFYFLIASIEINGVNVAWSSWGDCSVTCGQGKQTRSKICLISVCLSSSLVGTETQDCSSSPCPTNSSLITAYATYTPTSYSSSPTQNPTSSMYSPTPASTSSPTQSPTPASTSSPTQSPTSTSSSSPTQSPTSTPTSSPTQSPTSTSSPTQSPTSTSSSSPTQSPTSTITTSQPAVVIGNSFFTLSQRGCRYSNVRISRTVRVRNKFHCTSICARDSKCVAFNLDGIEPSDNSRINNEYLKCEILEEDYGSDISVSQVSVNCKNYERVTI